VNEPKPGDRVYRHSVSARITHWLWTLAMLVLVMSGLQIFNAAPYLDASYKTDPAHRVLAFDAYMGPGNKPVGTTTIFGHTFITTHVFGFTDDGSGSESARAFPGSITLPAVQSLADGRLWHLFFGWALTLAIVWYIVAAAIRKDLREIVLRPSDLPKLLPMQLYYLKLRPEPPQHGKYNPLQKAAYTLVLFVFIPLIILTGLALSPGVDAIFPPLTSVFGGRQFARTWHFVLMTILIAYFCVHMLLVLMNGPVNNVLAMITGWYKLRDNDGVGV
jgi:Ni/Fe-hydrogenase b-type cytochrome subunit